MSDDIKKTPLATEHDALGARMVPFAGWLMPVQYTGIKDEHEAVRTKAGLFDVSHMGEILVRGSDARRFLQWLTPNDVERLQPGKAQYSLLCTSQGTVVDDIIIYERNAQDYFICVNASNIEKDFKWIATHAREKSFDVTVDNMSAQYAQLALQGPLATAILQKLTKFDLKTLAPFHFVETRVATFPLMLARTGYTGEKGFELYLATQDGAPLWRKLMEVGKDLGLKPVGLGARDTLRLEMKYCLYGNDLDESHTALESGLGWVVKLDKGDFLGRQALQYEKSRGSERQLVGFKMLEKGIPRHGYTVTQGGEVIGEVTSGTHSPSLDWGIGLAYVPAALSGVGSQFAIDIRGRQIPAEVVKTPFYSKALIKIN